MAKSPKFYPNLPRANRPKGVKRVDATLIRTPSYTPKVFRADALYKPLSIYTPNWISVTSKDFNGTDERVGTKNANWRVIIANGGDATTTYGRSQYRCRPTSFSVRTEDSSYLSTGYGTMFGGLLMQENDVSVLEDQAIGRLKHKLSGKVGNAQLGPPIAESREIHRLVRQINEAGMSAFKALLAAKKTKGKSASKAAADIWLGFGFGVNPLLQDIKSAADSVMHYVSRQDYRVRITGTATQEYHSSYNNAISSSDAISAHATLGWFLSSNHVQGIRYVAGVDIKVQAGSGYSVADHLGLKLGALPSILWEITPYSWAIDYFTTVGSWLDDVFYTLPVTVKYLSKSYKYQCETLATPKALVTAGTSCSFSGLPSLGRYTRFTRTKLAPTLPTRSLRIKTVDEIASHGLTKLLNLGSIIAGRHGPKL
jgi:hypothetical protein